MAIKKLRFPLEMENGTEVRTIEELRENFSMEKVLLYYSDGRLLKWLRNNYLDEEAEAVSELDPKDLELNRKICGIFNVEYNESAKVNIEEITANKQRITRLKEFTSDEKFADVIDIIAFDQNELEELLQQGAKEIYLCGDRFNIPLDRKGISYIGVNEPTVVIDSDESVDFKAKNIDFQNTKFDEEYLGIVAEEKINADFSGSAEEWVAPSLKRCKVCANADEDIEKTISKYKKLGYYHYSMYLTDFVHDRFYGAQKYTKERHEYCRYGDSYIFRNVISVIADNMKYIKKRIDLSREYLTSIKDMNSYYGCGGQAILANYVKYSGIMLFNYNNKVIKYHDYVFRLGVLIPERINEKVLSRGIRKTFTDDHCCGDYGCTGYILPFDDIKEILLSKDTVLLSEDGGVRGTGFHCINGCEFFRDEVTNNPWIIGSYAERIDGSKIIYDDDNEQYDQE
ncbi:MAG: hypothetical protein ACI4YB_12655 [Oscillospiraceae bacterium]